MNEAAPLRVMWLLNHTAARKFEIPMLKRIGVQQIFLPKIFPADPSFRSASVDYSEDAHLNIPREDLEVLNAADWYAGAHPEAWRIANRHFDVVFLIVHLAETLTSAARYFDGAIVLRAFGTEAPVTYEKILLHYDVTSVVRKLGARFYFGEAYPHLAEREPSYVRGRRCYLPLGMQHVEAPDVWEGNARQIIFVCPDVGFNFYYREVYEAFCKAFAGFPYVVAGAQPIQIDDPKVLGFVSNEEHFYNMTQSRVMFYHSRETHHIHYHPFEAICIGMPLVFMGGGMLDRLGGRRLPGRCETLREARKKIKRILDGDQVLIDEIRSTQKVLLEVMKPDNCVDAWREGFTRIARDLAMTALAQRAVRPLPRKQRRIAVILPVGYRGGSLRGALLLTQALHIGSREAGEDAEVVFLHLNEAGLYADDDFDGLPQGVKRRGFRWRILGADEALRAMRYAGFLEWEPKAERYMVPDDGIQQLQDCDLWLVVSDRLSCPLLPVKPSVLMVYDYLQRYEAIMPQGADLAFLWAARSAERVLVTTEFTWRDATQYAGLSPQKVRRVPMLVPEYSTYRIKRTDAFEGAAAHFVWTTNAAAHKNHANVAQALVIYYGELGGALDCHVNGVDTQFLLGHSAPHLQPMTRVFEQQAQLLRGRVHWRGELPQVEYRNLLGRAAFLWHAARIDNGTFSVVEAAHLGVPSLSSDYPAMREMDAQFSLNLAWMDAQSPRDMAVQLKSMERDAAQRRALLPTRQQLQDQCVAALAPAYWKEVRACL